MLGALSVLIVSLPVYITVIVMALVNWNNLISVEYYFFVPKLLKITSAYVTLLPDALHDPYQDLADSNIA